MYEWTSVNYDDASNKISSIDNSYLTI